MSNSHTMHPHESTRTSLTAKIQAIEKAVRREPAAADYRWTLFQWLCVDQQWERAMQQLQVHVRLAPDQTPVAQAYRDLVRAEHWRMKTLAGLTPPGHVVETQRHWMRDLFAALEMAANGQNEASDEVRERALDHAPLVGGQGADTSFEWIGDSDSRLGPVCEIIVAGGYRWLSFADIAQWQVRLPSAPVDFVWTPCELTLTDGTQLHGFMPARYPDCREAASSERDDLLMGRRTIWHETGRTGVIASGRKTWMTSAGDFSLFDLKECILEASTYDEPAGQTGIQP